MPYISYYHAFDEVTGTEIAIKEESDMHEVHTFIAMRNPDLTAILDRCEVERAESALALYDGTCYLYDSFDDIELSEDEIEQAASFGLYD
jgi:hypothetical protein